MSYDRAGAFMLLLFGSIATLLYVGVRVFHATGHPPSFALCYSIGAATLLGWLAYFGSRA